MIVSMSYRLLGVGGTWIAAVFLTKAAFWGAESNAEPGFVKSERT